MTATTPDTETLDLLEHGGRLLAAARQYGIPPECWLDLSTGINPNGWPVPALPADCWQRLPDDDDELLTAAQAYYANTNLLAVAGSQAAIQTLPALRPRSRVGVLHPAYAEHAAAWRKTGHDVIELTEAMIDEAIARLDVLILINPNNPTGRLWPAQRLLAWHTRLAEHGGWLIVDEAFIDAIAHDHSLCPLPTRPGLIVLRSIGKFFGLAGIRVGFVSAEPPLLHSLRETLGPWSISRPARHVAALALADLPWQRQAAQALQHSGQRLEALLRDCGQPASGGCTLFQWLHSERAIWLHEALARQGILTRSFDRPQSIRFGLPGNEADWSRLQTALAQLAHFPAPTNPTNPK
ncbi:MAG: threonine-phosphate decarboxylase [Methylomonas sp.]|nr:MAG: threonine-phosphate decarboxylase [Methylomonas sp.]PPD27108.1 MAG: threonine-phosphate decarboxylase [Methylomonas sp.]PPD39062.1 MAG: threonine-phosphate decarboxylase [Methylomonas sp.]PPD42289.1 MAG: threonine-phosphate decarboxylase [Methylomonas sp.]PPD54990.1 MAG: threonine-phosphate decarboxylase [Methylomonas sp.]